MRLSEEEKAMLAGDFGYPKQWAIDHQIKVSKSFNYPDRLSWRY